MTKVKTFFHVFKQSLLPQPPYYRKLLKTDFSFSLKYFVAFIFILNFLFFSLFLSTGLRPKFSFPLKSVSSALKAYPANLSIEIKNGTLTTSYDRPYFFWLQDGDRKTLLAVVSQTSTPDDARHFEAPVVFTNRSLVIVDKQNNQNPTVIPYNNKLNFSLNKQFLNNLLTGFERAIPFITALILFFVFVLAPLFSIVTTFIYLAIIALLCYFVFSLYFKKHTYKKTLQVSMHAVTLPYLVKYTMLGFGYNLDRVWGVFMLLVVVFILSALYEAYLDK